MNAIMTAFFNGKTVLFTSYNNHPIDGVFQKLTGIPYQRFIVPFPIPLLHFGKIHSEAKGREKPGIDGYCIHGGTGQTGRSI